MVESKHITSAGSSQCSESCKRSMMRPWPALFMTVRREIAESRGETGARSREDPRRTRAVRWGSEGRARWPKARRSS